MAWIAAIAQAANGNQERNAAQDAGNAQAQGSRDAMQMQLALYNQGRQDNLNSLVTGNSAVNALARLYGLDSYTGQVNTSPLVMSGGQTTVKKPSFLQRLHDPGGFFWSQQSNTTPVTFSTGGAAGGIQPGGAGGGATSAGGAPDYSSFYKSPDYQVAYDEAMQGSDRLAAARGGYRSGGHLADVMRLGSNIGSQYFGNYTNNLMRIAGFGGQANSNLGAQQANTANGVSQNLNAAGQARADSYINQANSRSNTMNGLAGMFGNWYGSRQGGGGTGGGGMGGGQSDNWQQWGW